MKKYSFLLLLNFIVFCNAFSQEKFDSLAVFRMTSVQLDSFFTSDKYNKLDFKKVDKVIIAKLLNSHLVNKIAIEHIDHRGIRPFYSNLANCDSLLFYHIDLYIQASKEEYSKINFLSYKYLSSSDMEFKCKTSKYFKEKQDALLQINAYNLKQKAAVNLEYAKSCNHIADYYLNNKQPEEAQPFLLNVLRYKLWFEFDDDIDALIRLEYVKAGKNLLEIRKGDLKALERTFFDPYAYDELETIKKKYIEDLGGIYKLFNKEAMLKQIDLLEQSHKQIKN
jgi:hypothetical protein